MKIVLNGNTLEISRGLALDDSVAYETEPLTIESSVGEGHLVLSFEATFGFDFEVRVSSGYQSFSGRPLGRPVESDGVDVGYYLSAPISFGDEGLPFTGPFRCAMQRTSVEGRGPLGRRPSHQDAVLEQRLVEAWTPVVSEVLSANAAAIEEARRACVRGYMAELDKDIARHWATLSSRIEHRDSVRRAIRDRSHRPPRVEGTGRPAGFETREFEDEALRGRGIDEVVAHGVSFLHAETMSDEGVWIGATLVDGRRISINVTGSGLEMRAEVDDDPSTD